MSEADDVHAGAAGIGVWDWDLVAGEVIYDNDWAEMHGYSHDELKGRFLSAKEIVHPDYLDELLQIFSDQCNGKVYSVRINCFVKKKNGCWLWSNIYTKVVATDESCRPTKIMGIHQEMSETGSDEETFFEEIKKSGFCDGPVDRDGAVVFKIDSNGNIIRIGRRIEKILGYTVEGMVGSKIHDFAAKEDRENLLMLIENADSESSEIGFTDKFGNKTRFFIHMLPVSQKNLKRYGILVDATADKRAEPDSEALRHAIKSFAYPFALTDMDGIVTYVNRAALEQWGYDDDTEVLGMPYLSFFADDIKYREGYEQIIRESRWDSEAVGKRKDGSLFDCMFFGQIVRDKTGRPTNLLATCFDTSEQRNAERELLWSEERFRGLSMAAPDAIIMADNTGRVMFWNNTAETLFGCCAGEIIGSDFSIFIPDEFYENYIKKIRSLGASANAKISRKSFECEFNRRDGERFTAEVSVSPIKIDGKWDIIADIRDISWRKQMERSLRENEELYRLVFERTGTAMLIIGEDKTIMHANWRMEEISGYSRDEVVGRTKWTEYVVDEDLKRLLKYYPINKSGQDWIQKEFEITFIAKTGPKFASVIVSLIPGTKEHIVSVMDITKRKIAEESLRASERKYREMTDLLPQTVFECDRDGKLLFANLAGFEAFGCRTSDFNNNVTIDQFFIPEDIERLVKNYNISLNNNILLDYEYTALRKDGSIFPVIVYSCPITDQGKLVGLRGIIVDITERKRAEERLRASERKYREMTDLLPQTVFECDPDGKVLFTNRAGCGTFGYTIPDLQKGVNIERVFIPEDTERLIRNFNTSLNNDIVPDCGYTALRKDGSTFPATVYSCPITDQGKLVGLRGIIVDITERKRAEERLRASERKYREMTDLLPQTVFECDPDGNILFTNRAGCGTFGYTIPDLQKGVNIERVFIPEDTERLIRNFNTSLNSDIVSDCGYTALRKDGSTFPATVYSCPIIDQWEVVGLRGIVVDITDIRNAEQELRESEERLNLAIDSAKLGVWDVDLVTGKELYNKSWASMIGRSYDKNGGHKDKWLDLLHPDDRKRVEVEIDEYLKGKVSYYNTEFRMRCSDGSWKWVSSNGGIAELDINGRPTRMVGIHRDITEIRQYKESLKMANTKLNLLSGITRHDILNQVTVLNGYGKLLEMSISDNPDAQEYLDQIMEVSGVISQQIGFTKDYQDMGVNAPEWQCVDTVIRKVLESPLYKEFNVKIKTGLLEVYADPMLERVFYNLLDNAHCHGEGVTEITVSSRKCDDNSIIITIEDNGTGIPECHKKHIFEKGFGLNTGLGLFLVREILAITGFTIRETGEYGKGACFELSVPGDAFRKASFDETG